MLAELAAADPDLLMATQHHVVDRGDEAQVAAANTWWEELTSLGGEGMVVKRMDFCAR